MVLRAAITVRRPADELFDFWSDLSRLPEFMAHLDTVEVRPDGTSHWRALAPGGTHVEWDARIAESERPTRLSWESVGDADVPNSGSVWFTDAPGDRGTEVRVELDYELPGGRLAEALSRLFGEQPRQQVEDDLRRFKQVAETGEVVRSEGSPGGTRAVDQARQREAQPMAVGGGE
jgi:uncharacterized membrane protein